jgi:hypothetical protein
MLALLTFVLEILDLFQAFLGGRFRFIGTAEILAFFGEHFVTAADFFDHRYLREFAVGEEGVSFRLRVFLFRLGDMQIRRFTDGG